MRRFAAVCVFVGAVVGVATAASAGTLDTVKQRGSLNCGANGEAPGYGVPDAQGTWKGFDVDYCRAIAAAIFNDPAKVRFVALTAKDRFTALQTGDIDVLVRQATWTSSREAQFGLNATAVNYYDGQGFIVRKSLNVKSALELGDATVCVGQGTTTELNLADYFRTQNMRLKTVTFLTINEAVGAYDSGRCTAYTTDASGLYGARLKLAKPDDHVVLPEIISKEPLAPFVRQGDSQWFDVVRWVHFALVIAEEQGLTQANVDEQAEDDDHPRAQAHPRPRGQFRRAARPDERLGRAHRQGCRQLRRGVRSQPRRGLAAQDQAWTERAVDQRRPAIRAADPMSGAAIENWRRGQACRS
jgi:general L-amino acid transport system substrate-binding protein